jgi:transcriptional regulator with XRE-family HTH domain
MSGNNKVDFLTISDVVELIGQDANTTNQAEKARLMGITPQSLNNYLSGRNKGLPYEAIFRFAQKTGKPMEYYLTGKNIYNKSELMKELTELKIKLSSVEDERDRLFQVVSGNFKEVQIVKKA